MLSTNLLFSVTIYRACTKTRFQQRVEKHRNETTETKRPKRNETTEMTQNTVKYEKKLASTARRR